MIISDRTLKKYLKQGIIKITPIDEEQIGSASVDLTLSDEWYFFKNVQGAVDLKEKSFLEMFNEKRTKSIRLKPGQMCLAKTKEKIELPSNIMGKLEGRSRYARMGIAVHVTSAIVQPGSRNHQILEIVNLSPYEIILHEGMRISQILFQKLDSETSKPYAEFGEIARDQ